MEIYFYAHGLRMEGAPGVRPAAAEGFVQGFIDLVFRRGERYYEADWKSNYIARGYGESGMLEAMDEHNYHLQYKIYSLGLVLWLRQTLGEAFDYERHYGGALYLFLRGLDPERPREGLFFRRPEADELQTLMEGL